MYYVSWKYCKYEKIYIFMAPLVKYLWWLIECNFPDFSSNNLNWSIFSIIKYFTETSILKVYFQITLYLLLLQIIFRLTSTILPFSDNILISSLSYFQFRWFNSHKKCLVVLKLRKVIIFGQGICFKQFLLLNRIVFDNKSYFCIKEYWNN